MKHFLLLAVISCWFVACLGSIDNKVYDYKSAWGEIEKLHRDRLPQSMAIKVDSLYNAALKENKVDQQLKALVYQLIIMQQMEEFSAQKAISKVQTQLEIATFPASAILHSMLAQLYWDYYQRNRWRFNERSETIEFQQNDIATWDLKTISKESIKEFGLSLEQLAELQKYNIADYPAFVDQGGEEERKLRPTLFDFLAHRALEFYINDESGLTLPFEEFIISDTRYFQPAVSFAKMQTTSPDSMSLKYKAMLLYQDLIRFHISDEDPSALLEIDLDRLEFVQNNCSITDSEKDYETALRNVQRQYSEYPASAIATFKLAVLTKYWGDKYNPQVSEDYRWNYKNALELCQTAMNAYPKSFGGQSCMVLAEALTQPGLNLTVEQYIVPQAPVKALLSMKNLSGVDVKIYRIPNQSIRANAYEDFSSWGKHNYSKVRKLLKKRPLWGKKFQVENEGDFRYHNYELDLASLPAGRYIIVAANLADLKTKAKAMIGYSIVICSNITYAQSEATTGNLLLANRMTGIPLAGAEVKLYSEQWDSFFHKAWYKMVWSGTSDKHGMVRIPPRISYQGDRVSITSGSDILNVYDYYSYHSTSEASVVEKCLLFTDRSIYRPGQAIYVKGVLYKSDGEKHYEMLPDRDVEVTFWDGNGQIVERKTLRTNDYATFNCAFTAPRGVLTGQMTIRAGNGLVRFNVEEYKRPRFEVTLDKPKDTYKLGQYVTVNGKALSFSGFPIDYATVNYRINRQAKYPFWSWWWGLQPSSPRKEISNGIIKTDEKGEFSLSFMASGDDTVLPLYNPYFSFNISVDVTDISGETRSGTLSLKIGEKELILDPVLADMIDLKDKHLSIPIRTTNISNEPIAASGKVTISRLQTPDHVQKNRLWPAPDRNYLKRQDFLVLFPHDIYANEDNISSWKVMEEVWSGSFDTPGVDSLLIKTLANWEPGAYVLQANSSYNQQEVKATRYFTVYDSAEKQLPYPLADWFVPLKTVCEPGDKAQMLIGSGYTDVSVLMEVEKNHVIVDSLRFILDKEQRLFSFPVKEQDRGSFYVHFTWFRDGRFYSHSQEITVPWTNKEIEFEYMTYRDKILPGQEEEWRIKLKDHTGGKVTAEVLASMYDASLDAFISSSWNADVYGKVVMTGGWRDDSLNPVGLRLITRSDYYGSYPLRYFDTFSWYDYAINSYSFNRGFFATQAGVTSIGGELHIRGGRANEVNFTVDGMSVSDTVMEGGFPAEYGEAQSGVVNIVSKAEAQSGNAEVQTEPIPEDLSGVEARSNFAETAFFYPTLRTDEDGELSFVFTVPEALTRWKFRSMAISKDFKLGTSENSTVTQKPMMVLPNAPRFFREGDRIVFSTKITALDDADHSGNCQLFLFDALSMNPVEKQFGLQQAQQPFSVKKGESTVLSWELHVPFGMGAVTYKVVAKAGDFSDGEENTLPILSNRMLVTESLPLPVRGNSAKNFIFQKLKESGKSTTLQNHKLTLEFTSNPAWYAIQALPYMMEYPYGCNEQIFTRFYANSIASHIANSNPRIKRVFEAWKETPNTPALLSKLEDNQELKALLLQETPWVMDAVSEAQSKQRIGLLFELNNMANQLSTAISQLQKNQSHSGAWPWFSGMQDSWWVTQYIVEGMGHLDRLGISDIRKDSRVWQMIQSAISFTDRQIDAEYKNIKKYGNLDLDNLGYMEMHYLYARSFFRDLPIPSSTQEAFDYFSAQTDSLWMHKDLFGQGLIALARHREESVSTPQKIIKSLKERALHDEEMGMWWNNGQRGWFWYQAPIETQSLLIELFQEVAKDTLAVDELRTWLLKQKQTTNWKTTKATAEACYALLLDGTEWLAADKLAEITIAGTKLDPTKLDNAPVEAGTGYFKTSWAGSEITPQMANITVKNPNPVPSWGSLYWQYFENLDKITPAETPLRLIKKLFIERITDTGKVLDPVSDKSKLTIGDKLIVRIELRSDRDMEYVHLKDMRSAGFEPINVLSTHKWQDGLSYYEATGDAATNFFIEYLRKGTYVFEYPLRVTNKGDFSNGITTIQCMYAPEFSAHSEGIRIEVK